MIDYLSPFNNILLVLSIALSVLAGIGEHFTVYKWHPSNFERGLSILRTEITCFSSKKSVVSIYNALLSYARDNDLPIDVCPSEDNLVLIRTHRSMRMGHFRGSVRICAGTAKVSLFFSYVTFSNYLMIIGLCLSGLSNFRNNKISLLSAITGIVFMLYDFFYIQKKARIIKNFLMQHLENS
jgi:hypothetical protein